MPSNRKLPTTSPLKNLLAHSQNEKKRDADLTTLQRNALSQFLQRRNFTARDIASFDYEKIANLPKIGKKGIVNIRTWLQEQGLDLQNPPQDENEKTHRKQQAKLEQAMSLLKKKGYKVTPPI